MTSPQVILRDSKFEIVPLASSDRASAARFLGRAETEANRAEAEADRAELAEAGAESAQTGTLAALEGVTLDSAILSAANRTVLAALDHSLGLPALLLEPGLEGLFKWNGANLSVQVGLDPNKGKYVPPSSDTTGNSGAWVRTDISIKGSDANTGNKGVLDIGLGLEKAGPIIIPGAYAYMGLYVEGPSIWWDDGDGYYHMVFAAYSSAVVASVGHATSLDLVNWTLGETALFGASGVSGSPDEAGITGPVMIKRNGVYYLFYIGLTASGYEGGSKTICLATSSSLDGPWTRRGIIIPKGTAGTASDWRAAAVWHPNVVQRGGAFYLFFNATGSDGKERIGYATSSDLLTWTVQDAHSPLIDVDKPWKADIAGDPFVYRDGDYWFMNFYGAADHGADGIAWTTDADFPLNWVEHEGNPILSPEGVFSLDSLHAHKPCIVFVGGRKYHFYTAVGGSYGRCIALAVGGGNVPLRQLKVSALQGGDQELGTFHTQWTVAGDNKDLAFRNQEDQIVARMTVGYDGSRIFYSFGSLYDGSYQTIDSVRFRPGPGEMNLDLISRGTYSIFNLASNSGGVDQVDGVVAGQRGYGMIIRAWNGASPGSIAFQCGGVTVGTVEQDGLHLLSGKKVFIGGNQLLADRGSPLPGDAADLGGAIALANALKAAMIGQGFVAP